MKKIVLFVLIFTFLFSPTMSFAAYQDKYDDNQDYYDQNNDDYSVKETKEKSYNIYHTRLKSRKGDVYAREPYVEKVRYVGKNILKNNNIHERISFNIQYRSLEDNAYASSSHGIIYVNRGLFKTVSNDDELAAVLAHEIAHVINNDDFKVSCTRGGVMVVGLIPLFFTAGLAIGVVDGCMDLAQQPYENRADLKGVDLMVRAGYNPVAMITAYDKFMGDGHAIFRDHASATKRIDNVSRYIKSKYPQFSNDLNLVKENL